MGGVWTYLRSKLSRARVQEIPVLIAGLDGAGKTSILYRLKLGHIVHTIPTIGFNVEGHSFPSDNRLLMWDAGGMQKLRPLWRHYYQDVKAIIFVVDASDPHRIDAKAGDNARDCFQRMAHHDDCKDIVFLILANKSDVEDHMQASDVARRIGVDNIHQKYKVFPTSVITGAGIEEAFEWLAANV